MAEDINIKLEERKLLGKQVKSLRREGKVPAVIHDHGKPSIHTMGDYLDIYRAYRQAGRHHIVSLKVGDKTYPAIIKDAQFEPRKHQLSHVVFGAVKADEKVVTEIPIRLSEDIPAEKASLIVINQLETIEVEALPKDLPEEFLVDASSLAAVGDKLTVADVQPPAGVTILTEPEHSIATVYEPSALQAANDALAGEAEAEEASEVAAEHEGEASATVEGDQKPEANPGGKKQFEAKGE